MTLGELVPVEPHEHVWRFKMRNKLLFNFKMQQDHPKMPREFWYDLDVDEFFCEKCLAPRFTKNYVVQPTENYVWSWWCKVGQS